MVFIVTKRMAYGLNSGRGLSLIATGIAAVAVLVVYSPTNALQTLAQTPAAGTAQPSFEVATIKLNRDGNISTKVTWYQYTVTCKTAEFLIAMAYGRNGSRYTFPLRPNQIEGGPHWVYSKMFDVDARVEESLAREIRQHPDQMGDQMRLMLQSLLADRFKLKVSHSTKDLPGYALVAAKGGVKFLNATSSWPDPMAPGFDPNKPRPALNCQLGWVCDKSHISMAEMAAGLSLAPEIDRPVFDQTGLKGVYFLDYTYEHNHRPTMTVITADGRQDVPADTPQRAGPTLQEAMEKQLGLKLEPTKGLVDVLVIDHIEMPTEN